MHGRETKLLNLTAAVVSYMYSSAWIFPVLILFGGMVTYVRDAVVLKKAVNEAPGDEGACSCELPGGVRGCGAVRPGGFCAQETRAGVLTAVC